MLKTPKHYFVRFYYTKIYFRATSDEVVSCSNDSSTLRCIFILNYHQHVKHPKISFYLIFLLMMKTQFFYWNHQRASRIQNARSSRNSKHSSNCRENCHKNTILIFFLLYSQLFFVYNVMWMDEIHYQK